MVKIEKIEWKFVDSHYRWGSNASDNLWEGTLPEGRKVYCWGWEADPRDEENSYSSYYSLVPPKEVWDESGHPQGYDLEDEHVFGDLEEILEYLAR